jgi:ferredoxin
MRVDQSACIGCGLCLSACPTGVFSVVGLDVKSLIDDIMARIDDGAVTLRCANSSPPESAPNSALELPCIGMLDDDLVLALAAGGVRTLILRVGDCEECVLHARGQVDTTLAIVRERWPGRLAVEIQQAPSGTEPDFAATLDGLTGSGQPAAYDRRDFLRGIIDRARDMTTEPAPPPPKAKWGARPLPTRVPARRNALLASLQADDRVAFPRIAIGESCDGCQDAHSLCDRFCPTGALHRVDRDAGAEFVFLPEICVDCGQCAFVCPQDAIHREESTTSRDPVALRMLDAGTCSKCGRVATPLVDELCPECAKHAAMRDVFIDLIRKPE